MEKSKTEKIRERRTQSFIWDEEKDSLLNKKRQKSCLLAIRQNQPLLQLLEKQQQESLKSRPSSKLMLNIKDLINENNSSTEYL